MPLFEDYLKQRELKAQAATSTNPLDTTGASAKTGKRPYVDTGDVVAAQPRPTQIDVSGMPTPPARSREQVEADARRAMVSRPEEPQVAPEEALPQTEVERLQEPVPAFSQAVSAAQQAPQASGLKLNPYVTGGSYGTPIEDIAEKAAKAGMEISPEARADFNGWYLEDGLPMVGATAAAVASGGITSVPSLLAYSFVGAASGELAEQTAKKSELMKWAPGETPWDTYGDLATRVGVEGAVNAGMDTLFLGLKPAGAALSRELKTAMIRNATKDIRPGFEGIAKAIVEGDEELAKIPMKYILNKGWVNLSSAFIETASVTSSYARQRNAEGMQQIHKYLYGQGVDPRAVGEATDIVRKTITDDLGSLGAQEADIKAALDEFDMDEGLAVDLTKEAYKDIDPRMFISRTSKAMESTKVRLERDTREIGASIGDLEVRAQVQNIDNYDELSELFTGKPMGDKERARLEKTFGKLPIAMQNTVERLGTEKARLVSTQDNLLKADPMKYQEDTKKLLSTRKVELTTQLDDLGKSYKESMDTLKAFGVEDGNKYITMSDDQLMSSNFETLDAVQRDAILTARELRGTIDDTVDKIGIVNDSFYALDKGGDEVVLQKSLGHTIDELMLPYNSVGRAAVIRSGMLNAESWVKVAAASHYAPLEKIMADIESTSGSQFVDTGPLKAIVEDRLETLGKILQEEPAIAKLASLEDDVLSYKDARALVSKMKDSTAKLRAGGDKVEAKFMGDATRALEDNIKEALKTAGDFTYTSQRGVHSMHGQDVTGDLLLQSYEEANGLYKKLSDAKGNHWVKAILEKADTDSGMANQVMSTALSDPVASKALMNFLKEAKEVQVRYGTEATDAALRKHGIEPTSITETHAALKAGAMVNLMQPQVVEGQYKLAINKKAFEQQEALRELFTPEEMGRINNMRKIIESVEASGKTKALSFAQGVSERSALVKVLGMAGSALMGYVNPSLLASAVTGYALKGKLLNAYGRWLLSEDTTKLFVSAGKMNLRNPIVADALQNRVKAQVGKIYLSMDEEAEERERTVGRVQTTLSGIMDTRTEAQQVDAANADIEALLAEIEGDESTTQTDQDVSDLDSLLAEIE